MAADWVTLLTGLLGGGSSILGSILSNERAKDIQKEGQERFEYGKEGMESLLAERQTAYNNVWKMIYGGVENFDFDSMMAPQGVSISSGGRGPTTTNPSGAQDPTEPTHTNDQEKEIPQDKGKKGTSVIPPELERLRELSKKKEGFNK